MTASRGRRALLAALVAGSLLLGVGAGLAAAEEGNPVPSPITPTEPELPELTIEDTFLTAVVKGGFALIGLVVLVQMYDRRKAVRRGLLPPPFRTEPTVVFPAASAIGLVLLVFIAGTLIQIGIVRQKPELADDVGFRLVLAAGIQLPLAGLILLRRARLEACTAPAHSRRTAVEAFFVSQLLVIPAAILSYFVVEILGGDTEAQDLVKKVFRPKEPWHPLAIGAYGVLLAPLAEEAIFRALLFPALRAGAGGGVRGAWVSALVTSVVFAAMHQNLVSFLPLLCLAMVLAWVMETTNSLWACTAVHAGSNLLSLVLLELIRP